MTVHIHNPSGGGGGGAAGSTAGLVPYVGAVADVALGLFDLNATIVSATTVLATTTSATTSLATTFSGTTILATTVSATTVLATTHSGSTIIGNDIVFNTSLKDTNVTDHFSFLQKNDNDTGLYFNNTNSLNAWYWDNANVYQWGNTYFHIGGGVTNRICQDSGWTNYVEVSHDGTDANLIGTNTTHFDISGMDVHVEDGFIIPVGTTPTPASEGALFLDSDAGTNGTLKCYSNGDWRTVTAF